MRRLCIAIGMVGLLASFQTAASTQAETLYEQAVQESRVSSFDEVDLGEIETLWLPARYTKSGTPALFIRGVQYAAPGGDTRVVGFTHGNDGNYLVAVAHKSPPIDSDLPPLRKAYVHLYYGAIYRVSKEGKTLERLFIEETYGCCPAVVGSQGIFMAKAISGSGTAYLGVDLDGKPVQGPAASPSEVTPTLDGGWLVIREKDKNGSLKIYSRYKVDANGKETHLGDTGWMSTQQFQKTENAYINMPTYTDGARTGFTMYTGSHGTGDFRKWQGAAFSFTRPQPQAVDGKSGKTRGKIGHYVSEYGNVRKMSGSAAIDLAQRSTFIGTPEQPLMIAQMDARETKGLYVGVIDLLAQEGAEQRGTPLFKIHGSGMEVMRSIFGNNSGSADASSRNDAMTFVKPDGSALVVFTGGLALRQDPVLAYDVGSNTAVDPLQTRELLNHYQVEIE